MNKSILALSEKAGRLLIKKGLKLAVAESCTGGLLGAAITEIPGSSSYFNGGVISYANKAKTRILGVPAKFLKKTGPGAVSAETVGAMARGARKLLRADVAIAVSGIAGPDGGTDDKPVGLVYLGIAVPGAVHTYKCRFKGTRAAIREQSALHGLRRLIENL